jgi:hypothetical protein
VVKVPDLLHAVRVHFEASDLSNPRTSLLFIRSFVLRIVRASGSIALHVR